MKLEFLWTDKLSNSITQIIKVDNSINYQISFFMKNSSVGAELFRTEGQMDRH
jgi:hypothetical protein